MYQLNSQHHIFFKMYSIKNPKDRFLETVLIFFFVHARISQNFSRCTFAHQLPKVCESRQVLLCNSVITTILWATRVLTTFHNVALIGLVRVGLVQDTEKIKDKCLQMRRKTLFAAGPASLVLPLTSHIVENYTFIC